MYTLGGLGQDWSGADSWAVLSAKDVDVEFNVEFSVFLHSLADAHRTPEEEQIPITAPGKLLQRFLHNEQELAWIRWSKPLSWELCTSQSQIHRLMCSGCQQGLPGQGRAAPQSHWGFPGLCAQAQLLPLLPALVPHLGDTTVPRVPQGWGQQLSWPWGMSCSCPSPGNAPLGKTRRIHFDTKGNLTGFESQLLQG